MKITCIYCGLMVSLYKMTRPEVGVLPLWFEIATGRNFFFEWLLYFLGRRIHTLVKFFEKLILVYISDCST